jgi:ABC-type oligopeptide transport system ATPase subunit
MTAPLLELSHVSKIFGTAGLLGRRRVPAVSDVSFALPVGASEIFTIVGQSGSGKTTLARMILGMEAPSEGTIRLSGHDIGHVRGTWTRKVFMSTVQPIFQNPFEAFNPLRQVDYYLFLTARRFGQVRDQRQAQMSADVALRQVGLSLPEVAGRYPHELSGGQLQRTAIARALLAKPKLIVADEPVSMVDASLRMSIVNLFKTLRDELGISLIYITHDLATAYYISDRILIMHEGKVVESGDARTVLTAPQHAYSQQLKDAVLVPDFAGAGAAHRTMDMGGTQRPV